jgi:hypothetical protein
MCLVTAWTAGDSRPLSLRRTITTPTLYQAAEQTHMLTTLRQQPARNTPNVSRSIRLEVETLEGRVLPSTLGVLAYPATVATCPPQAAQVRETLLGNRLNVDGAHANLLGGKLDLGGAGHVTTYITRSSGEEIPQTLV